MLQKCPECQLQVSDKALQCPHCGFPMQGEKRKPNISQKKKRRRLPNGFGGITKLSDRNLRNPYRVLVTVGKAQNGRPITKSLKPRAYFATYEEAYAALIEYNKNPCDLTPDITVQNLYNEWSEKYFSTLKSSSSKRTITSAWAYCADVYNMRVKDIRARHIKYCMEEGKYNDHTPSENTKARIKSLWNLMLDYAVEYELADRNYARTFNSENTNRNIRNHISFTEDELTILWQHSDNRVVRLMLIQCYGGWRPQEIGLIRRDDTNITDRTFIGGMKTEAGTNRTVPIHSAIREFVREFYNEKREYLFTCEDGSKLTYDKYSNRFKKVIKALKLNPEHKAHDGRKTFVTLAKKYNVDEYAIKYIVGHAVTDITEKVYTDRDPEWLKSEIEKIKA